MLDPRSEFSKAQMAGLPKSWANAFMAHLCLWKCEALDYKTRESKP